MVAAFVAIMQRRSIRDDDDDDDDESNECIDENEEFFLNGNAEQIQSIRVSFISHGEIIASFFFFFFYRAMLPLLIEVRYKPVD